MHRGALDPDGQRQFNLAHQLIGPNNDQAVTGTATSAPIAIGNPSAVTVPFKHFPKTFSNKNALRRASAPTACAIRAPSLLDLRDRARAGAGNRSLIGSRFPRFARI
jgi:hypothetical protein